MVSWIKKHDEFLTLMATIIITVGSATAFVVGSVSVKVDETDLLEYKIRVAQRHLELEKKITTQLVALSEKQDIVMDRILDQGADIGEIKGVLKVKFGVSRFNLGTTKVSENKKNKSEQTN